MKFWRENKIANEFEMPVAEVADKFMIYARENGVQAEMLQGLPVERALRWWLTSPEGLNSVWTAESLSGKQDYCLPGCTTTRHNFHKKGCPVLGETFSDLHKRVVDLIFGRHETAEIDTSESPTFSYSQPDKTSARCECVIPVNRDGVCATCDLRIR